VISFFADALCKGFCVEEMQKGVGAKNSRQTRFLAKEDVKKLSTICFVR